MKNDFIKTSISVCVVMFILFIGFLIIINVEQGIELLTRTELPKNDPDVSLLYSTIENNVSIRKANFEVDKLTDEEVIELVIGNLTKDDYTKKTIKADKIVCEVTSGISFNTDGTKCNIRIIKNSVFTNYLKNNYNIERDIEFGSFNYHGYNCENNGKNYYCLYSTYNDYVEGHSAFLSAYKTKDSIIISEYYLQIDLNDNSRCNIYYDEEYCKNFKDAKEKKSVSEKTIKKDGVLYEHVFLKVDDKYYLQKSYLKNEG